MYVLLLDLGLWE